MLDLKYKRLNKKSEVSFRHWYAMVRTNACDSVIADMWFKSLLKAGGDLYCDEKYEHPSGYLFKLKPFMKK